MQQIAFNYVEAASARKVRIGALIVFPSMVLTTIVLGRLYPVAANWDILLILIGLAILFPPLYFIKSVGYAAFHADHVAFYLAKSPPRTIRYADISAYVADPDHGARLTVWLQDGTRLRLGSYSHYNQKGLLDILEQFEREIDLYRLKHPDHLIVRHESTYEKNWVTVVLIVSTAALLAFATHYYTHSIAPHRLFWGIGLRFLDTLFKRATTQEESPGDPFLRIRVSVGISVGRQASARCVRLRF